MMVPRAVPLDKVTLSLGVALLGAVRQRPPAHQHLRDRVHNHEERTPSHRHVRSCFIDRSPSRKPNGLRGTSEPLMTYRKMAIQVSQADPATRRRSASGCRLQRRRKRPWPVPLSGRWTVTQKGPDLTSGCRGMLQDHYFSSRCVGHRALLSYSPYTADSGCAFCCDSSTALKTEAVSIAAITAFSSV
jgi:hypothetical protein